MIRTRQLALIVCLLSAAGSSTGCAVSAIDDTLSGALANQERPHDAGKDARQATVDDSDDGDDGDDSSESPTDASISKDASAPKDAAVQDAGTKDGGVDAGKPDAGPPDAAVPDSGTKDASTPQDASTEPVGECSIDSDCKKLCILPFGFANCCKADHSCGCTSLLGTCS